MAGIKMGNNMKVVDTVFKTRFVLAIILFCAGIYAYLKWNLYWISQRVEDVPAGAGMFIDDIFHFMLVNNMCILGGIGLLSVYYFFIFYRKAFTPLYNLEQGVIDVLVGQGIGRDQEGEDTVKYLIGNLNGLITRFRKETSEYELCVREVSQKVEHCIDLAGDQEKIDHENLKRLVAQLEEIRETIKRREQ